MLAKNTEGLGIVVIIPCFKVRDHILKVIDKIGPEVQHIIVVDDACPEHSGNWVQSQGRDPRVQVLFNKRNLGVGGAVMAGYEHAATIGARILVKLDGDDQMDPGLILRLVNPIVQGEADYTKGNRFFNLEDVRAMPKIRLVGNAALSFFAKLSTGYWDIFDPTNGFTALHASLVPLLGLNKISQRYFFETDMLFRLNTLRAVVMDIPMAAKYGSEVSNLRISRVIGEFFLKHLRNFFKRIFYNYYLRDMSLVSIQLPLGLIFLIFGGLFGGYHWYHSIQTNAPTTAGTVMLSALPILTGMQMVLNFFGYDINATPNRAIHRLHILSTKGPQSSLE